MISLILFPQNPVCWIWTMSWIHSHAWKAVSDVLLKPKTYRGGFRMYPAEHPISSEQMQEVWEQAYVLFSFTRRAVLSLLLKYGTIWSTETCLSLHCFISQNPQFISLSIFLVFMPLKYADGGKWEKVKQPFLLPCPKEKTCYSVSTDLTFSLDQTPYHAMHCGEERENRAKRRVKCLLITAVV